jgi:hypothetical protein
MPNTFTFSSTRDRTPLTKVYNDRPKHFINMKRDDYADQDKSAKEHREKCSNDYFEKIKSKIDETWKNPETVLYTLKILLYEACRLNQSYVICNNNGVNIKKLIYDGYKELIDKMEITYLITNDTKYLIDTINILGIWYKDIVGPSHCRRHNIILEIYHQYLDSKNVDDQIKAFDEIHDYDHGRISEFSINNKEILEKMIHSPTVEPLFSPTTFVAQSRELRQLITLRKLKEIGKPFLTSNENSESDRFFRLDETFESDGFFHFDVNNQKFDKMKNKYKNKNYFKRKIERNPLLNILNRKSQTRKRFFILFRLFSF